MQTDKYLLLLNLPIPVRISSDQYLYVKTPSIEDYESFIGYSYLANAFSTDIETASERAYELGFVAESYSDIFIGLAISLRNQENNEKAINTINALEQLCGISVGVNGMFYNGVEVSEEALLEIRHTFLLSLNKVQFGDDDKEQVERNDKISAAQAKIDKIRGRNTDVSGSIIAWTDVIASIIYYMGMSVDEIKKLNYLGLSEFYIYAQKAQAERINLIAAGNGHTKEYKNITDR